MKGIIHPVQTYQVIDLRETMEDKPLKLVNEGTGYSISVDMNQLSLEDKEQLEVTLRQAIDRLKN